MEQRNDYLESQIDILSKFLRKLLSKILVLNVEGNINEIEKELLSEKISNTHDVTLSELLKIDNAEMVNVLTKKFYFTHAQLKLVGDILFEYAEKINSNKNICNKAKILYQYYQANELKTIDFAVLSRIKVLKIKITPFLN